MGLFFVDPEVRLVENLMLVIVHEILKKMSQKMNKCINLVNEYCSFNLRNC